MHADNFTASFTVDRSPEEVFGAINNVRGWWSEAIEGTTDRVGGRFRYCHKDLHVSTQEIIEFLPGWKVIWQVVDSQINFVRNKDEWTGSRIVFDIGRKYGQTQVRLTHVGLVPALECFSDCSGGWGFYFGQSLHRLITTGKGQPDPNE